MNNRIDPTHVRVFFNRDTFKPGFWFLLGTIDTILLLNLVFWFLQGTRIQPLLLNLVSWFLQDTRIQFLCLNLVSELYRILGYNPYS